MLPEKSVSQLAKRIPRSDIRSFFEMAKREKDIIDLTVGDPDFETPAHIREAAKTALDRGYTHYTPNAGFLDLRERIADKVANENKVSVDAQREVIVTSGGMSGLHLAATVTIDPGDEVLIPEPTYPNYNPVVLMAGGKPIPVHCTADNSFRMCPEDLAEKVSERTKAIIMSYPSNPTGADLSLKDLQLIADICEQFDVLIIADEAYEKIVFPPSQHQYVGSLRRMKERTIGIFSLSKTYAMTGWRIGYTIANEDIISEMVKFQEFMTVNPSSVSQRAALAALEGPQDCVNAMVKEYEKRRNLVIQYLREMEGVSYAEPRGAFYVFPRLSQFERSDEAAVSLLRKAKVATVPGSAFGRMGEGHIRISYAASEDKVSQGMSRIAAMMNRQK